MTLIEKEVVVVGGVHPGEQGNVDDDDRLQNRVRGNLAPDSGGDPPPGEK